ncbi:hypothetical protein N2152v2_001927 [Parachlorella kessleri]
MVELDPAVGELLADGVLDVPPQEGCPHRTAPCGYQLLLLGAYLGERKHLDIGKNNPLKWWSRRDVMAIHHYLMSKYTDNVTIPGLPSWLGVGFNAAAVRPEDKAAFQAHAGALVNKLNVHGPWAIKDNRLGYTAPLWLEMMDHPVCVLAYRHPALTAVRLSQHPDKGRRFNLTPEWYLGNWEEYMLRALHVCAKVPTVLLPTDLAEPRSLGAFYTLLEAQLRAAGASSHLRIPDDKALYEGFVQYWREGGNRTQRSAVLANGTDAERSMQLSCTRPLQLPVEAGGQLPVAMGLPELWPHSCSLRPTSRTLGLVHAFDVAVNALLTTGRVIRPAVLCKELLRLAAQGAEMVSIGSSGGSIGGVRSLS